jgi:hypothetical protein
MTLLSIQLRPCADSNCRGQHTPDERVALAMSCYGGALESLSETCQRMRPITSGSVMIATTRKVPTQKGRVVTMSFPLGSC